MFELQLITTTVRTAAGGAVARVVDATDWSLATPPGREAWAVFLALDRVGSVLAQEIAEPAFGYDATLFQTPGNPAGTVDVPLPADGVYRVRGVAVPAVADAAAVGTTFPPTGLAVGTLYYRLDTARFAYKGANFTTFPLTWAEILEAGRTDAGLLARTGESYTLASEGLRDALARLNLAYLQAGPRARAALVGEYAAADLLIKGAARQSELGFYADAVTSLNAASRLLGSCLPNLNQSLPALRTGRE